jgi:hypothetical protein
MTRNGAEPGWIGRTREQDQEIEALSLEHGTVEVEMAWSQKLGDLALVKCADGHQAIIDPDGRTILPDLGGTGGHRWLIVERHRPLAEVRANGRRQALTVAQARYGGRQHPTPTHDVLVGARLGRLPLRALTPRELEEMFG